METQNESQNSSIGTLTVLPLAIRPNKEVTLAIPSAISNEEKCKAIVIANQNISVITHEEYLVAGERIKIVKKAYKEIVDDYADAKRKAHETHASICSLEKKLLLPLEIILKAYESKVKAYLIEEKRKENIEIERRRIEADAESKRIQIEAQKKQDDERLKVAQQLEAHGFKAEAEAVISQDVPSPLPTPIDIAPIEKKERVAGQHLRSTWKAKVDNLRQLVNEVYEGRQPLSMLLPNQQLLDSMASALKKELRIPGVSAVENSSLVTKD